MPGLTLDTLNREVNALREEIAEAKRESATMSQLASRIVRQSRIETTQAESKAAMDRLRPDVRVISWMPRAGEASPPELSQDLVDRLKQGDPVSGSLGNTDPFSGLSNLLSDPNFDGATRVPLSLTHYVQTPVAFSMTLAGSVVRSWDAYWYSDVPGSSSCTVTGKDRGNTLDSAFASSGLRVDLVAGAAGLHYFVLRQSTDFQQGANNPVLPFLVGALRTWRITADSGAITNATVELRIMRGGSAIASSSLDWRTLELGKQRPMTTAYRLADMEAEGDDQYNLWVVFTLNTTGAATSSIEIGEPQLHWSYTPDPVPYSPNLVKWHAPLLASFAGAPTDSVIDARVGADVWARYKVAANGNMTWGGGAIADMSLVRAADHYLQLQAEDGDLHFRLASGANQVNELIFNPLGQNAALVIKGDQSEQGIRLGSITGGLEVRIYRSAFRELTVDDVGGGTYNVLTRILGKLQVRSLRLQTKAGVPVDGDIVVGAESGDVVLDTTNSRIYFRVGTTWKYAALT